MDSELKKRKKMLDDLCDKYAPKNKENRIYKNFAERAIGYTFDLKNDYEKDKDEFFWKLGLISATLHEFGRCIEGLENDNEKL